MEAKSQDDALVARINDLMHRIVHAALPGAYLVEIFPAMKHLPTWMAKWKREGLEWYAKDTAMFEGFMDTVRNQVVGELVETRFSLFNPTRKLPVQTPVLQLHL